MAKILGVSVRSLLNEKGMYSAAGALPGYVKSKRPNAVAVDITILRSGQVVKEGDEILVYEHYSEELVFEYNKNKEVDHPEADRPVCR